MEFSGFGFFFFEWKKDYFLGFLVMEFINIFLELLDEI
jgi:hypothetical protein